MSTLPKTLTTLFDGSSVVHAADVNDRYTNEVYLNGNKLDATSVTGWTYTGAGSSKIITSTNIPTVTSDIYAVRALDSDSS